MPSRFQSGRWGRREGEEERVPDRGSQRELVGSVLSQVDVSLALASAELSDSCVRLLDHNAASTNQFSSRGNGALQLSATGKRRMHYLHRRTQARHLVEMKTAIHQDLIVLLQPVGKLGVGLTGKVALEDVRVISATPVRPINRHEPAVGSGNREKLHQIGALIVAPGDALQLLVGGLGDLNVRGVDDGNKSRQNRQRAKWLVSWEDIGAVKEAQVLWYKVLQ